MADLTASPPVPTRASSLRRTTPWDSPSPSPSPAPVPASATATATTTATANGHAHAHNTTTALPPPPPAPALSAAKAIHPSNLPGGKFSLAGIAARAFGLGLTLGVSVAATCFLVYTGSELWRTPFFLVALSVFHFLEYLTTARFNTQYANTGAFLLSSNGSAYNAAHTCAMVETTLSHWVFAYPDVVPREVRGWVMAVGFGLLLVGQFVRSLAMVQAGKNFNHTVQVRKAAEHELVTTGVYGVLRHPSYFGFFWWGLGTQIVLGNPVCFAVYAVVLWKFFSLRIKKEEELLIKFFGAEYVKYRQITTVGIPFIW